MHDLLRPVVQFLAILNPFALCLYLESTMDDLRTRQFMRVLATASLFSLVVFWIFAMTGDTLLIDFLGVRPAALRMFGGVIFFVVGYNYATKGHKTVVMLRGSIEELPSAIAVPFMIGAGTITQAMILGRSQPAPMSFLVIALVLLTSFIFVVAFKITRDRIKGAQEQLFDRYIGMLSRINGLVIGAISTEMIMAGMRQFLG